MQTLPNRQAQLLELIARDVREGRSPVVAELARAMRLAGESGVTASLKPLELKGLVSVTGGVRGRQRVIELTHYGKVHCGLLIPVLGAIPAGPLAEAINDCEEWIDATTTLLSFQPGDFMLPVAGDSMIGAGILSGDRVQLRPSMEVANGEIAAVLVHEHGEARGTLKHFYHEAGSDTVRLRAANPAYEDLYFRPEMSPSPARIGG